MAEWNSQAVYAKIFGKNGKRSIVRPQFGRLAINGYLEGSGEEVLEGTFCSKIGAFVGKDGEHAHPEGGDKQLNSVFKVSFSDNDYWYICFSDSCALLDGHDSYTVDWGDGTVDTYTDDTTVPNHCYSASGDYTVTISDDVEYFCVEYNENVVGAVSWGTHLTSASYTYKGCYNLKGSVPAWSANVIDVSYAYQNCESLEGDIPAWGASITSAAGTYSGCTHIIGAWTTNKKLLMPDRITVHGGCVSATPDTLRYMFTEEWGGGVGVPTVLKVSVSAGETFYFYENCSILGYEYTIDWGDGSKNMYVENSSAPSHTYAAAGTYTVTVSDQISYLSTRDSDGGTAVVELVQWGTAISSADSAFLGQKSLAKAADFTDNISSAREAFYGSGILSAVGWGNVMYAYKTYESCSSLKSAQQDWNNVNNTFHTYKDCTSLTGPVPAWGDTIKYADGTYSGCTSLTGSIPRWGTSITSTSRAYEGCVGLTVWSGATDADLMPSAVTNPWLCVSGATKLAPYFTSAWGGTKTTKSTTTLYYSSGKSEEKTCSGTLTYSVIGKKAATSTNYYIYSVDIGSSVTELGANAISYCNCLYSVAIPSSVTSIGSAALACNRWLKYIEIPNSVTYIGENAFSSDESLSSITLGKSVATIGTYAFSNCPALASIALPDSVTKIGSYAFIRNADLKIYTTKQSVCDLVTTSVVNTSYTTWVYLNGVLNKTLGVQKDPS